ncbi:twin-arginine translocase subunit TatC [Aeromicrobium sp. 636]|uniref:Sec-independent protein translocase protein TatC n=2 Tax=Nocardioidaceae TaxID=85015 RepID=A0A8I0JZ82_9ACTN|nr:twin-arginine translocase subunit TatC [Aeromicrobium senzhongii]MBC9225021.1 twin-arginine translocase subunit TatC [Aeromicrobium senzhongii]MCQ3997132.1 twin-arginine translocase subunit TatC [Aeromicrobium sp. 636]MTB87073.1 twin-arginine translocase subunit TatC [Aeromicrobium senzhongii]QNL95933.1 twin-arginine translocase subunit TatC [Aeromicrobium senzhongii]
MPLLDHLAELRSRLVKALAAIALGVGVAWYFYPEILEWLTAPYEQVRPALEAKDIDTELVVSGIGGAFQFQLKTSVLAGLVLSSPVWMWQLWAFVLPALHRNEKRAALLLTATCLPLFLGGAWVGYWTFPKAIELLVGFAPEGWTNLLNGADYLSFATRMIILFGVGAQIPVVVVILNRIGAVSGAQLIRARPWIIVGIFVFAAVATPTVDPVTFLFLAIPMSVLYFVSEIIARVTDRRRGRATQAWGDEEASPLEAPEGLGD